MTKQQLRQQIQQQTQQFIKNNDITIVKPKQIKIKNTASYRRSSVR